MVSLCERCCAIAYVSRYHLFGDTPQFAMKMESTGVPDEVHISESAYLHIRSRQMRREQARVNAQNRLVLL